MNMEMPTEVTEWDHNHLTAENRTEFSLGSQFHEEEWRKMSVQLFCEQETTQITTVSYPIEEIQRDHPCNGKPSERLNIDLECLEVMDQLKKRIDMEADEYKELDIRKLTIGLEMIRTNNKEKKNIKQKAGRVDFR
ncbi:unnamed protein product [Caenorhabditis brenneri]